MAIIKLRSKNPISNLHAMRGADAFLTATFTDIKVLPFSGVIRYFGEFLDYDENGLAIPGTEKEVEIFSKREELDPLTVDQLFAAYGPDFSVGEFSANLESFIKTAFIQKVAADGRYGLTVDQMELV